MGWELRKKEREEREVREKKEREAEKVKLNGKKGGGGRELTGVCRGAEEDTVE